jgi:hypothetical protein
MDDMEDEHQKVHKYKQEHRAFSPHLPVRIRSVTTPFERAGIFVLLVLLNFIAVHTYCSSGHDDALMPEWDLCPGVDYSVPLEVLVCIGLTVISVNALLWLVLDMMYDVRHRYDYYFQVIRHFTLIHHKKSLPGYVALRNKDEQSKRDLIPSHTSRTSLSTLQESRESLSTPLLGNEEAAGELEQTSDKQQQQHQEDARKKFTKDVCIALDTESSSASVQMWYTTSLLITRQCAQLVGIHAFENVLLASVFFVIWQATDIWIFLHFEKEDVNEDSWKTDIKVVGYCSFLIAAFLVYVLGRCAQISSKFEFQVLFCVPGNHCVCVIATSQHYV